MSFQDEHAILVASPAAYETPPATSRWLFESGRRFGIEVTPIGRGQPYPNHRAKVRLVADYLRDHPEYRYVLQVDLRDVIFCGSLREIFQKYRAFGRAIVCSSERDCWPVPSYRTLCPETGTSARFVNSGLIMATAEAWLAAWDRMCQKERDAGGVPPEVGRCGLHIFNDDQAAWTDLYAHGLADIALDSRSEIFQNLCHTDPNLGTANDDFRFEGRRVVNRETGGRPCAIHPNGGMPVDPWARYILGAPGPWSWSAIRRLRDEPRAGLADPAVVERHLLDLGLHQPVDDDVPGPLLPFSGKGLLIRRRPSEFAPWLARLAGSSPVRSYVEVGVGDGGAFLATVEILRRSHPPIRAVGVGVARSEILHHYARRTPGVRLVDGDRASDGLRPFVDRGERVDLTLIEADRPDGDFRADWESARLHSRAVAIHGIGRDGPSALWREIKATHRHAREFVDPTLSGRARLGLGVVEVVGD